jgi:tRNA(Ile)-lysidine synthase
MRDPLLERVRASLAERGLLSPGALVLVAVSGGPDSLCLLHLLNRLRAEQGPRLHVAHLDHGLRPESPAEAAQVAATAAAWDVPATVERREVRALPGGDGPMAEARRVRYAFLAETAIAVGANAVAVAHQADDQAETVLMHLLRGAGPAGLRGMREMVPWAEWAVPMQNTAGEQAGADTAAFCILHSALLIRPLLTTTRAEIEAYCAEQALAPTSDPSNHAPRYARSRVRRLLGALANESPRAVEAIGRAARLTADDYDFMQGQLDAAWPSLAEQSAARVRLRRESWEPLHAALQRYALRRAAALLGVSELSLPQVEAARALAARPGRSMRLGARLHLRVDDAGLTVSRLGAAERPDGPQLALPELALANPGSTTLGAGWRCEVGAAPPHAPEAWQVALDAATLDGPLTLRRRRPGDRFWPAGGRGSRKLQDFFVDRKLPRPLRDAWPILATPGAIIWVPGLRADRRFAAEAATQGTIWVALVRDDPPPTTDDRGVREEREG